MERNISGFPQGIHYPIGHPVIAACLGLDSLSGFCIFNGIPDIFPEFPLPVAAGTAGDFLKDSLDCDRLAGHHKAVAADFHSRSNFPSCKPVSGIRGGSQCDCTSLHSLFRSCDGTILTCFHCNGIDCTCQSPDKSLSGNQSGDILPDFEGCTLDHLGGAFIRSCPHLKGLTLTAPF